MILELLRRLELAPDHSFVERELASFDPEQLARWRDLGIVTRVTERPEPAALALGGSDLVAFRGPDGQLRGYDPEHPEEASTLIDELDFAEWRLDVLKVASQIARRHAFVGRPERLTDRLIYVGHPRPSMAVVLALFKDAEQAAIEAASLRTFLTASTRETVILTIHFAPTQALQVRNPLLRWARVVDASFDLNPQLHDLLNAKPPEDATGAEGQFGEGFGWVVVDGEKLKPSLGQRAILLALHRLGGHSRGQDELLVDVGLGSARIYDIFKGRKGIALRGRFLEHVGGGRWRFKVESLSTNSH